jgi:hypothetical protein
VGKRGEATSLFVYGSLLDPILREQIIGRRVTTLPATLQDYEVGRARYFFIRKHLGMSTPGLLLLDLTPADFQLLDRYEDLPRLYTREEVEVLVEPSNSISCWVYLPTLLTLGGKL